MNAIRLGNYSHEVQAIPTLDIYTLILGYKGEWLDDESVHLAYRPNSQAGLDFLSKEYNHFTDTPHVVAF